MEDIMEPKPSIIWWNVMVNYLNIMVKILRFLPSAKF